MVVIEDVERGIEELVRRADAAELTGWSGICVSEVATCKRNVWVHVFAAGYPAGWADRHEFDGWAGYLLATDSCDIDEVWLLTIERKTTTNLDREGLRSCRYMATGDTYKHAYQPWWKEQRAHNSHPAPPAELRKGLQYAVTKSPR